jgi:hypothetical protein
MKRKRMPKGLRKHIRQEKARIRRETLDFKKQEELIKEIYQKVSKKDEDKRNLQPSDKKGN